MAEEKKKNVSDIVKAFIRQLPWMNKSMDDILATKQGVANFGAKLEAETIRPEYQKTIGVILTRLKAEKERQLYNPNPQDKNFNRDKAIGYISAFVDIQSVIENAIAEGREAARRLQDHEGQDKK